MSVLSKKITTICQRPERRTQSPGRRISCKDLGQGDCEGWLWNKKYNIFKSKFVRRWCILKNNSFYYYIHTDSEKAEGKIYIQDFKVSPIEKFKSNNFYFKIYNEDVSFTFGSESKSDFTKWLNKLQLSANNVDVDECHGVIGGFSPAYTRSESSTLKSNITIPHYAERINRVISRYSESEDSDIASDIVADKTSEDSRNNEGSSESTSEVNPIRMSLTSAERVSDFNRTTLELSELTMSAIKRIVEIERLIRNKRLVLSRIDEFLKLPTTSENIRHFWEDNHDEIIIDVPFIAMKKDVH